ncbi:POU domain class 2-associating factor 1 [Clinocottus analis]|uniref:POU domain class 2-associating factor 1 n=1 Tax=Clinocottus analis TaxID=304258 RepID=UPI0035C04FB4
MHWEKSPPSGLVRSRPYQGVRVRDPVKELLRRKRSLEPQGSRTAPPTSDAATHNVTHNATHNVTHNATHNATQLAYTRGDSMVSGFIISSVVPLRRLKDGSYQRCFRTTGSSLIQQSVEVLNADWLTPRVFEPAAADGALQSCAGWRAAAASPWSPSEYSQQDAPAPASTLSADVYMQTLCPSYTMLTYTHAPLLTGFGSLPVAPGSIPQVEFSDSGLTYLPWAQPITAIATMPNQVQFGPGSAPLAGSPLVHVPLSMSLTTMISQLEAPGAERPQMLDPDLRGPSLEEDPGLEAEAPSLLDKLLEERKGDEEDKDSYSSSLFISNA